MACNDTTSSRSLVSAPSDKILRNLLVKLSLPDPLAWEQAAKEFQSGWQSGEGEPILQALRLWAGVQASSECLRHQLRRLTPAHGFWLEHSPSVPLGFARLMLESARRECLDGKSTGLESLNKARDHLRLKALEEVSPRGLRYLRALSVAYWAEELRVLGRHGEAGACLAEAYNGLDSRADGEIRVTVVQVDAELLRDTGAVFQAKHRLNQAAAVLPRDQIPGRWSELQLVRGRLHLFDQKPDLALPLLQDALRHCPEDRALSTRLEVLHCLAAVEASLFNYAEAQKHLDETQTLSIYGHRELHGQRLWLLGHVALKSGRPDQAEDPFEQSFSVLRSLGRWSDAARVLMDLTEVYLVTGRLVEKTPEVLALYASLAHTDELGRQARSSLEKLRRGLLEKGLSVPELEELHRKPWSIWRAFGQLAGGGGNSHRQEPPAIAGPRKSYCRTEEGGSEEISDHRGFHRVLAQEPGWRRRTKGWRGDESHATNTLDALKGRLKECQLPQDSP